MTDIEVPSLGARTQAGQNHSLDDEMRQLGKNEAVFDRSWLALVGIADDIFFRRRGIAHRLPLLIRGISGATHAAQSRRFDLCQKSGPVARSYEFLQRRVWSLALVGVARQRHFAQTID